MLMALMEKAGKMQEYIGNDNRGNAENQKYCSRNEE
jgi:hypothetical protein